MRLAFRKELAPCPPGTILEWLGRQDSNLKCLDQNQV